MRKIIIDCDPGHDDAIAICLAVANKEKLKTELISTVAGNHTSEKITKNALKIVELLNIDTPVAKGSVKPLIRELEIEENPPHGHTGMDGPVLPEPKIDVISTFSVEYMANLIRQSREKVTIVAIGPLTNIALLIRAYPDIVEKIEEISLMGGGIFIGNATSASEFNIYVDPEAAKVVFNSGIPITMSGLDVTNKAYITKEEFTPLKKGGKISKFVYDLLVFYNQYAEKYGFKGSAIHDACTVMWLLNPELFEYKMYPVDIVVSSCEARGQTLADTRYVTDKKPNVKVLLDVDREKFVKNLLNAFENLDKEVVAK
ncbi:MAG: nucleoside hydrolase [Clostridia bacterium]|nr:nucleoside hydrolase [Clostridia bacterium]